MRIKKIFIFLALSLVIGLWGCSKEQKVEAPKQEQVTKNLVPSKTEAKGPNFSVELSDLKISSTVDTASKEIVETPRLSGSVKIVNSSKDILDIQGITLEYLDEGGKPIAFKSGEKISKVSSYFKPIKPEETFDGSIDATIPRAAVKEKVLAKIEVNVVYIPSPLRRETVTVQEKIE
jgi:hypothetical protein